MADRHDTDCEIVPRHWMRRAMISAAWILSLGGSANVSAQSTGPGPQLSAPVTQQNGSVAHLPLKLSSSRLSGLSIAVDSRWSNNYGYRPIEVTISSAQPTKVDHTIAIRLHPSWGRTISVEQEFELPAGSTSASVTVSMPSYELSQNNCYWDLWVDGVKDKDLSADPNTVTAWTSVMPTSSNSGLTFLIPGPQSANRSLVATNGLEFAVLSIPLTKFPTRWIDYTAIDAVAISLDEAQKLATSNPVAFEALERWTRAGGQLWVSDVGKEFEHLSEISKLLHLSDGIIPDADDVLPDDRAADAKGKEGETPASEKADEPTILPKEGWRRLRFRRFNSEGQVITFQDNRNGSRRTVRDPEMITRLNADPNLTATDQRSESVPPNSPRRMATDSGPWFVQQYLGLGAVRAFRGSNEVAKFTQMPATANPNAVANSDSPDDLPRSLSIGLRRTPRWDTRYGMTPDSANTEFDKLLVPGVGRAPVNEFRVLITLFVITIGPLNYWLLKRAKRLHLMVLTVPLAALVTTLCLFSYAILSDGFDTRVRAQSFTMLDQRTGEAACWSRLSYYSGLAPGNGLAMPTDLTVYPVLPSWVGDLNLGEERTIYWGEPTAQFKQGWLNSRTPTQYLTIRARKSPYRIEVFDSGQKLRVKNQLGTKILSLVVFNETGKFYLGEDITADGSIVLQPIERKDAVQYVHRIITSNMPEAPAALASGDSETATLRSR
ncbi:MAG TPA: hypothetical protein VHU84_10025, partial [Lacipirellulaceae bacterium]|nr:hypothetical protein [Lacipirellulaceae bacterium]